MKKIIAVILMAVVIAASSTISNAAPTIITVGAKTVSIKVGNYEYVANSDNTTKLVLVRVWNGPDSLKYDLEATHCDYSRSVMETKKIRMMTDSEAAMEWAKHVAAFDQLKNVLEVHIEKNQ